MECSAGKNRATQLFVAGCCAILVICAIQVWHAQHSTDFLACRNFDLSQVQQVAAGPAISSGIGSVELVLAAPLEINATPTPIPAPSLSLVTVAKVPITAGQVLRDAANLKSTACDGNQSQAGTVDNELQRSLTSDDLMGSPESVAIRAAMRRPEARADGIEPEPAFASAPTVWPALTAVPPVHRAQPNIEDLADTSRMSRTWPGVARPDLKRNREFEDKITGIEQPMPVTSDDAPVAKRPHGRPIYEPSIKSDVKPLPPMPASVQPQNQRATPHEVADGARSAQPTVKAWPCPEVLIQQLEELPPVEGVRDWAQQVTAGLGRLEQVSSIDDAQVPNQLENLYGLVQQAQALSANLSRSSQVAVRQTAYALNRRLDVWIAAHLTALDQQRLPTTIYRSVRPEMLVAHIDTIRQNLAKTRKGDALDWEQYLALEELERSARGQGEFIGPARVELAQIVLDRLTDPDLTPPQVEILQSVGAEALGEELLLWATRPVSQQLVLAALERFEQYPNAVTSRDLANYRRDLHWSAVATQNDLAFALDQHYRNANVRISVNESMLNRLVPAVREMQQPVRDRVLGAHVHGQSRSQAKLLVRMLPDRSRLRLMFEARGVLASRTTATKGPVTLLNRNNSRFHVRKVVLLDRNGPRYGQSQAIASGHSNLLGLRTTYDNLPIIGPMVRRMARKQHSQQAGLARKIFVNRVEQEARQRVDQQIESELARARKRLEQKLIAPMRRLDLNPQVIEMQTRQGRMVVRGRLAADHQLAAFTARPQAYLGSLLTMQVHESALNNFLGQLQLDGRQADLKELYEEVTAKLQLDEPKEPEDIPENVTIRFANRDAVRVSIDDGVVRLKLRIKHLSIQDDRSFKNFEVTADYRPFRDETGGVEFYFSRDRGISLSKRKLALRAIFTKVLSQNRKIYLVNPELASDHRFAHLNVTQMEISDGWIGLSVGEGKASPAVAVRLSGHETR